MDDKERKIVIFSGGTGGHIYPGIAIAKKLKNLGIKVIPLMTKGIKTVGKWIHYCSSCGISSKKSICIQCGNRLSRKLITEN